MFPSWMNDIFCIEDRNKVSWCAGLSFIYMWLRSSVMCTVQLSLCPYCLPLLGVSGVVIAPLRSCRPCSCSHTHIHFPPREPHPTPNSHLLSLLLATTTTLCRIVRNRTLLRLGGITASTKPTWSCIFFRNHEFWIGLAPLFASLLTPRQWWRD